MAAEKRSLILWGLLFKSSERINFCSISSPPSVLSFGELGEGSKVLGGIVRKIEVPSNWFKVTPDLRGCPPVSSGKKTRMRTILKENRENYISLERFINVDFGKNMNCRFFLIPQKEIVKMTAKMTMCHSIRQMN